MSTCQSVARCSTNHPIFGNKIEEPYQSTIFLKKLLAISISSITYNRAIFPDTAYNDHTIDELNLKILHEKTDSPGALKIIKWLRGCFDAITKKYLRVIILEFADEEDKTNKTIEKYTFKLSYFNSNGLDIYNENGQIQASFSEADNKSATMKLLRTISVLTHTLGILPQKIKINMKLFYYDEVTPANYEPIGFVPSTGILSDFAEESVSVNVGSVHTPWHGFSVNSTAIEKLSTDLISLDSAVSPRSDAIMTGECVESPYLGVKCPCGFQEIDGLMIICNLCKHWQHAICYSILEEKEAPLTHVCYHCAKSPQHRGSGKISTSSIARLSKKAAQDVCLFRRALLAATETREICSAALSERLGVSHQRATALLQKLEKYNIVIKNDPRARKGWMIVCHSMLAMGLVEHLPLHAEFTSQEKRTCSSSDSGIGKRFCPEMRF